MPTGIQLMSKKHPLQLSCHLLLGCQNMLFKYFAKCVMWFVISFCAREATSFTIASSRLWSVGSVWAMYIFNRTEGVALCSCRRQTDDLYCEVASIAYIYSYNVPFHSFSWYWKCADEENGGTWWYALDIIGCACASRSFVESGRIIVY